MAKKETLTIASVLSYEKKIVPSDGYFYGAMWAERKTNFSRLKIQEKSVRGTISNRLKAAIQNDPLKLNAEVEKANLQRVDACALGVNQDTLMHQFTLKFLGGVEEPSACNNSEFKQSYEKSARRYINEIGFNELARRYAQNIANARFLWRNRVGAENLEVNVKLFKDGTTKSWTFNSTLFDLHKFDSEDKDLLELSTYIAKALSSKNDFLLLEITTYVQLGIAQEVYPSEELVLDKGKGTKSKILYSVNDQAAMHSQKIGNALRTIDTWYSLYNDEAQSAGAIAIEPYGAVTNLGKAFRTPKDKQDFYSYFDRWSKGERLERIEDEHYVMAVLIRGGVFGESSKE